MSTGMRDKVVDFVAQHMRKNPNITMPEIKELAEPKGMKVYPLIMGLARKKLGISKGDAAPAAAPRAGKKKRGSKKRSSAAAPAMELGSGDLSSQLQGVFAHMQELETEVQQLRRVVAGMRTLLDSAN